MHTRYTSLDGSLNGFFEDAPVSPDIDDSPDALLNLGGSALISGGSGFRKDGREGNQKVILVADFGLLTNLWTPQYQHRNRQSSAGMDG